jgi:hypothetical protein
VVPVGENISWAFSASHDFFVRVKWGVLPPPPPCVLAAFMADFFVDPADPWRNATPCLVWEKE